MVSQKRVYLSYSFNDKQKVDLLRQYLIANGFELVNDSDILPGESWKEVLMNHLKTSDYILICLTKKMFRDGVFRFEYEREFFETAKRKDIITIPLLMEDLEVPLQFKQFDVLDFREFTQDNLARLVRSMRSMDEISFDRLDAQQFEGLVYDLLVQSGYENVQKQSDVGSGGIDFIAEYYSRDPFNRIDKQTWMVETKFYRNARFSIQSLRQVVAQYKYINPGDAKLLLVTNVQLTSVVKGYLAELRASHFIEIQVLDGFELRKVIASNGVLKNRYFQNGQAS